MRKGYRNHTGGYWAGWIALLALCFSASVAWPQDVVVCQTGDCGSYTQDFDNLEEGVIEAIRRARTSGNQYVTVFLVERADGAAWEGGFGIPADANIAILGVPLDADGGRSNDIEITGTGSLPALTISTEPGDLPVDAQYFGGAGTGLRIEGVALVNSTEGLVIKGDVATGDYMPVISRCYISGNASSIATEGNGVRVEGEASPLLVNCSIVKNENAGVLVTGTEGAFAEILHCSILYNEMYGVHVTGTTNNARVRNSLVYRNGNEPDGTTDANDHGGLVWDTNPFIDPDTGPVAGGITVIIKGFDLTSPLINPGNSDTNTHIFFGPMHHPDTEAVTWVLTSRDGTTGFEVLTVTLPPSYLGAPGPVDVTIQRVDTGQIQTVRNGFVYVADGGEAPVVMQVIAEHGPSAGGNIVAVYGANFEEHCDVFFDFEGSIGSISVAEQCEFVEWLSSGHLIVKVPEYIDLGGNRRKVDVLVRNNTTGIISDTGQYREYEYRIDEDDLLRPVVVQIVPNYFRDLEGTDGAQNLLADVEVWDAEPGATIKVGGILCPYEERVRISTSDTPPVDVTDPENAELWELHNVRIPVAEFGSGGSYDVEVTNPTGLYDILPRAFTYYPDGVERFEPNERGWRPSNFVRRDGGLLGTLPFRLLGTGFDWEIAIRVLGNSGFGGSFPVLPNPPLRVFPHEVDPPHARHTQREVFFNFPPAPEQAPFLFNPGTGFLNVTINNVATATGDYSSTDVQDVEERFFYSSALEEPTVGDRSLYFEIELPLVVDAGNGPNGRDIITMTVLNWRNAMRVYVADTAVTKYLDGGADGFSDTDPDADQNNPSDNVPDFAEPAVGTTGTIQFEAPRQPQGVAGPVDVWILLPDDATAHNTQAADLYYYAEKSYSVRPEARPIVRAVVPRTPPEDTFTDDNPVRVLGSNFVGPVDPAGWFTNIWLDWGDGTNLTDGNEISLGPVSGAPGAGAPPTGTYQVNSFNEIEFTLDLPTLRSTNPLLLSDVPVTVVAALMNAAGAVYQYNGSDLSFILTDALSFESLAPIIDDVTPLDGPVEGGTTVTITGRNFFPDGTTPPYVRFGGREARVLTATPGVSGSPDVIEVESPPAHLNLPATVAIQLISVDSTVPKLREAVSEKEWWFTYFMDGKPQLRSMSPNHMAFDDTFTQYATLTGLNFDDVVIVRFLDAADPTDIRAERTMYSESPTTIQVKLPLPGELVTESEVNGFNKALLVTVQNDSSKTLVDAQAQDLISNPVLFTVFDDSIGDLEPQTATLLFNDVFWNQQDYVNVHPGEGSISVDPLLDPGPDGEVGPRLVLTDSDTWWLGKLALGRESISGIVDNPLRDKAGEFTLVPFSSEDLELEVRPDSANGFGTQGNGEFGSQDTAQRGLPDIGADEINDFPDDQCLWYYARVFPSPVGRLDAGELQIDIRLIGSTDAPEVYIVPQGFLPADVVADPPIPLSLQATLGENAYRYTNDEPIPLAEDGNLANPDDPDEPIVDGHATLIITCGGTIIGADPSDLTEGGLIFDQAITGRHFLIDTVPPRMFVEYLVPGNTAVGVQQLIFDASGITVGGLPSIDVFPPTTDYTDQITALSVEPLYHPFPATPAVLGTIPPLNWTPATDFMPQDYGGVIDLALRGTQGAQVFFNRGSQANPDFAASPVLVEFPIGVRFVDPPVTNDETLPLDSAMRINGDDFFTSSDIRQVSGFPVLAEAYAQYARFRVVSSTGQEQYFVDRASGSPRQDVVPQNGTAADAAEVADAVIGNEGVFDPGLVPGDSVPDPASVENPENDQMLGLWNIRWDRSYDTSADPTGPYHVSLQFEAEDLAGNVTRQEMLLDPLQLWWFQNVQSRLSPSREGRRVNSANFTLSLERTDAPIVNGGPPPIFMYRVWQGGPDFVNDYNAVYTPVSGWSVWSPDLLINTVEGLVQPEHWVLVVVQSADEAGNVEPWPNFDVASGGLRPDPDAAIDFSDPDTLNTYLYPEYVGLTLSQFAIQAPNWQRFYLTGAAAPDTIVKPTFWHNQISTGNPEAIDGDEITFGQSTIIPMVPESQIGQREVEATFELLPVRPRDMEPSKRIYMVWQLLQNGVVLIPPDFSNPLTPEELLDPDLNPIRLALDEGVALGDPARLLPYTYVFQAAAFVDENNNSLFDNQDYVDPSPASVLFVVTPTDIAGFVRPPESDEQPIKETETQ
ncbi:MAG: hypothetical protein AMXMBFR84_02340 [Candidatus Hydrogenedentota bacterium]